MNPTQAKLIEWRHNAEQFAYECLNLKPDEWQKDGLAFCGGPTNPTRRVGFKACTGPGKTLELGVIGWHRMVCFGDKGEHPKGAALSGEGRDNLRDNLWAELSKLQSRNEFLKNNFTWTGERLYANDHPETWFLAARSYPKDADAEKIGTAISGLHSKFPFLLLDETGNMPPTVGQRATQIFTGGQMDAIIAQAGNPTSTAGLLYHSFSVERALWNFITITADPNDPKRTPRVTVAHAQQMIDTYGRDNPWVMATILGEFPSAAFNTLLSAEEVRDAMKRSYKEQFYQYAQKRIGVDVARFGDDMTVLFPRQGLQAFKTTIMRGARTNVIADRVIAGKVKWGSENEFVDGTGGFGAGVVDNMMVKGYTPHEINFSSSAMDEQYFNKRTEMWFAMRDWIRRGGAIPNIDRLGKELAAPTYYMSGKKMLLEPKELIKKRLGFSPDYADALALTFALPEAEASIHHALPPGVRLPGERGRMVSDVDPFDNP